MIARLCCGESLAAGAKSAVLGASGTTIDQLFLRQ